MNRRTLRIYAVSIVAQYGLDVLAVGPHEQMLAIRAVWAFGLLASSWRVDDASEVSMRLHRAWQTGLASLSFLALLSVSGGSASPYFELYAFLPLLLGMMYPHDSIAVGLGGALVGLGAVGLLVLEGQPGTRMLLWAGITTTVTLFGAYGAAQFRKAQRAESQAQLERARREALEQLAISERRRAQSEKLATIGQLAAGVAHEINNPLAFISSNLQYLQERPWGDAQVSPEELAEVLRETFSGVERVQQIAADLRRFSRMEAEEPAECSLAEVVSDAVRLARLRLKYVARVEVDVPAQLPPVLAVRRRLDQVLLNLLVNAGDALEEHRAQDSWVRVTARQQGARVLLTVEDNGPGFAPGVLPHLFEAFFTTKGPEKGTGLGLSLSREMVEQFGGTLVAENREEGGARLRMELPCEASHLPG
jgi:signal transduction histidine kinase